MKITNLETFFVKPRWCFLKVSTDEGLVGWGEPVVEGRSRTVAMCVEEFKDWLLGQDPLRIEYLWQGMYRGTFYRGGPVLVSAISGIEQALWDIKGKFYNMPVYEMLGGRVRDRIRMYGSVHGATAEQLAEKALGRKFQGFTAVKNSILPPPRNVDSMAWLEMAEEKVAAMREAVGKEMDVAIDCHGRLSPAMSIRFAQAIEKYCPLFLEEPCLPENVDAMVRVAQSTTIPIATGERLFTRFGFREVIEKQAAHIVQPDICHAGGIFEAKKIAAMAETYYGAFAPHNPLGPISLASCIQVDACTPNFLIQEHPGMPEGWDRGEGYLKLPFVINNGYIDVPTKPGLGIEVDEDVMKERSYPGNWQNPRAYHEDDGSIADW